MRPSAALVSLVLLAACTPADSTTAPLSLRRVVIRL